MTIHLTSDEKTFQVISYNGRFMLGYLESPNYPQNGKCIDIYSLNLRVGPEFDFILTINELQK